MSHYIAGEWINSGTPFNSVNPATGEELWKGGEADAALVNQAVEAADQAFDAWVEVGHEERVKVLNAYAKLLSDRKEEIAQLISAEMGKPLWEARGEVGAMVGKVQLSIDAFDVRCAEIYNELPQAISITRHKPHGVVAVFGPFNFPGHLPNGHIVPALLAGNTVVLKPSELTPATGELMVRLWEEAGLPPGVLNMVQGGRKTGQPLAEHPRLNGLFFTGSSGVGQKLSELFGKTPERILALEMGGNNPLIVWEPEDLRAAAYQTVQSAFITAGQRCTCARRLIVPDNSGLVEILVDMVQGIRVGAPTIDPEPFAGPLVCTEHADQVMAKTEQLVRMGATWLVESKQDGALVTPGILDVTAIPKRPDEEIFGPILQVVRVATLEDAIREANNTRYGLAAGMITKDPELYKQFYRKIRAGIVNWNMPTTGASSAAPFGGVGCSGNHRPSAFYAADYCSYPVASMENQDLSIPENLPPGISLENLSTN